MKLPLLSGKQVARKGSHVKMKHKDGRLVVFPFQDELDRFTLKGALRDAEIDVDDFQRALR